MRILFINQYFPPDASATAYILGELAEDLALCHEVHVVAARPSYNASSNEFRPVGVIVHTAASTTFHREALAGRLVNYATFLISSFWTSIHARKPDIVVAMTDPPLVGAVGLVAAKRHRCPFVFISHDVHPDIGIAVGRLDNRALVWMVRALNRALRRFASRIIVVGRDMREKFVLEGVDPSKLTYLPNWANLCEPSARAEVRATMGWGDRLIVMHAGNIGLAQNLEIAIEAASLLKDRPEIQFVLMGDGAKKDVLKARAEHLGLANITFQPYLPKADAQQAAGAADIHLVSLVPGLKGCAAPSKVYGIMATGRPFIAAVDAGSEPDRVIKEYGCGVRIEPNDGPALARAISELTLQSLQDMGAQATLAFLSEFDRRIVTEAYRTTLERVHTESRKPR